MSKILISLWLIICTTEIVFSQNLNNNRLRYFPVSSDTIKIDTLSIIPGSVIITDFQGNKIPDSLFYIDYGKSEISRLTRNYIATDSIKVQYKVFPYNFNEVYYHKDLNEIVNPLENPDRNQGKDKTIAETGFFANSALQKQGSLSRNITIGNNQDAVINSSMNLQLSGKISEDLSIAAVISDKNVPLQPEGTTQQLQEFDKVYISIYNKTTNLTVGDFEIESPDGYFMQFYKKSRGFVFLKDFDLGDNSERFDELEYSGKLSGAVSKGKYCKQTLESSEGNQGPYRIYGSNDETYIVILAGTEKVYIDGKLMTRGEKNDYTIDYQSAELTFTTNQPITKDKRIVIEFEYSEVNYARFLLFNSNVFNTVSATNPRRKSTLSLNFYTEFDAKNQTLQQDLTTDQKKMLANAGDDYEENYVPNVDSVGFDNDQVLYKLIDTIVDNQSYDSIYVYSTNEDNAVYSVGFTYIGENSGNYVRVTSSSANGKVYKWVAPEDDELQGEYEPVYLLVAPVKKQMLTISGNTKFSKSTTTNYEIALSNYDLNTFSSKSDNDNVGCAGKFEIYKSYNFKDTTKTKLKTGLEYSFIHQNFNELESFRDVEFDRNWNIEDTNYVANEHYVELSADFSCKKNITLSYDLSRLSYGSQFKAIKNYLTANFTSPGFKIQCSGSMLNSDNNQYKTTFYRNKLLLSKNIKKLNIGIEEELENNQWYTANDSLLDSSYKFYEATAFIQTNDKQKNKFYAGYSKRIDYASDSSIMKQESASGEFSIKTEFMKSLNYTLSASYYNRKVVYNDSVDSENPGEDFTDITNLGRFDFGLKFLKTAITSSTFYELGSGLEAQKEYSYVQVTAGEGVYTWIDANENGVCELDEFEVAAFSDEAEYVRVYTTTTYYTRVYTAQFNYVFNILPYRIWGNKKGWKKLVSRFSNQFAFRQDQSSTNDRQFIDTDIDKATEDTTMMSLSRTIRNTFSINKTSPKFGTDYVFLNNYTKSALLNGYETNRILSHSIKLRTLLFSFVNITDQFSLGEKQYVSEYYDSKNYTISYHENTLETEYSASINFQASLQYRYAHKDNILSDEKLNLNDVGFEISYRMMQKGNLVLNADYINIGYKGETSSTASYIMLEGLDAGNNATWKLQFNRTIAGNLNVNILYSGRYSESDNVIHTGSIQFRVVF